MVEAEVIGLYRVSVDLWILRSIIGGLGVGRTCLLNDFPWGHWRKWNLHTVKYDTSSVWIPCSANHED